MKKILAILLIFCAVLSVGCMAMTNVTQEPEKTETGEKTERQYQEAVALYQERKWKEARAAFYKLGNYKDSRAYYEQIESKPKKTIIFDNEGKVERLCETQYTIDERGYLLKAVSTWSDDLVTTLENTYDNHGFLTKDTFDMGSRKYQTTYYYDKNGNLESTFVDVTFYSQTYSYSVHYQYDSLGFLIKEVHEYSDGVLEAYEFFYDEEGYLLQKVFHDNHDEVSTYSFSYDNHGNVIREIYAYGVDSVTVTEYRYDDEGNMIEEIFTDNNGKISDTEYSDFVYVVIESLKDQER